MPSSVYFRTEGGTVGKSIETIWRQICPASPPSPLSTLIDLKPNTSLFPSLCLCPTVLPVTQLPSGHLTPCISGDLKASSSPLPHYRKQQSGDCARKYVPWPALASPGQLLLLAEQSESLCFVEPEVIPKMPCLEGGADPTSRLTGSILTSTSV